MVYIFSETSDLVSDLVIEWLVKLKTPFKRFNDRCFNEATLSIADNPDASVSKVWQRRGCPNFIPKFIYGNYPNRKSYINYISKETNVLNAYYEYKLRHRLGKNYIGSLQKEQLNNKLVNLEIAKAIGFSIPKSIITNNKRDLLAFYKANAPIISKDLRAPVHIQTRNKAIVSTGVKLISKEDIEALEEYFVPIFIQQYTPKKIEVRAFIICDKLYAMAIFSQNDEQTKVDFRNYNRRKPNRCVPFVFPEKIEQMIWEFMRQTKMNTGSLDFIVTPAGDYVFLEINPMGQFHWLSENCNYQIEKAIAAFLSNEEN